MGIEKELSVRGRGLNHPVLAEDFVAQRQAELLDKVSAFADGAMSWEALLGTFVELVDDSVDIGVELASTGRLQHYALGYIHGLTDRDNFLPMTGV